MYGKNQLKDDSSRPGAKHTDLNFSPCRDFRSAVRAVTYEHRSVAHTDTCFTPNILGRACFFPYVVMWRPSKMYKCILSKIGLDNFEGTFAGNGKMRVLFCAD